MAKMMMVMMTMVMDNYRQRSRIVSCSVSRSLNVRDWRGEVPRAFPSTCNKNSGFWPRVIFSFVVYFMMV